MLSISLLTLSGGVTDLWKPGRPVRDIVSLIQRDHTDNVFKKKSPNRQCR